MSLDNGVLIIQSALSNQYNQQWQINKSENGTYTLINRKTKSYLDVQNQSQLAGTPLVQWLQIAGASQEWSFELSRTLPPTAVDTTKIYALTNRNSGKSLGTVNNSTADGTSIEQRNYTGAASQDWKFIDAGAGYLKIKNVNSGKFMDIAGASTSDSANNILWTETNGLNQQWQLVDAGSGYYKIKNRNSGKMLAMNAGSTADGALSIQWSETGSLNQNWSFSEVAPLDLTKSYTLTNRNSGKSLGIANNATTVVQNTYGASSSQAWQIIYDSAGYYKVKNVNSGKFMDVSGASIADGAQVVQSTSSTSISQQWQLIDFGGGYFIVKNRNSGKVLCMNNGTTAEGGDSIQWTVSGTANQNWSFTVITP
ncbi:RICIN domain-containing protein [Paenibacillus herberti]|uniref:Ricin B lectin domain-containing protein n=1 Tax=Paenibacillus herberti TaxID=1619309 RepID=A0A229P0S9_9BACL|nr:RICIN domain-containing protein [Paenibacillus herberti]OXM15738.1 hypothetical protein CGZ75_03155 [Paenibacillus herberti]